MKSLNGLKVYFFKGTAFMPNVMFLPGKILVKKGTPEERYVKTLMS